jgi:hypothetical protein
MNLEFGPDAPFVLRAIATTALVAHISGGTVGMISGAVAMFAPKGSRAHQLAGTVFFVAMLTMAGIAAVVAPMLDEDRWTNTTAAVFTLYLITTAWATVRRRAGTVGRFERLVVVVPLAILAMGIALAAIGPLVPRPEDFATVYVFAVVSGLSAVADLTMIRRGGLRGAPRLARHLWRMGAALFVATGSFFFGQAEILPVALRASILPTLLGLAPLALMAFWMARVRLSKAAS